MKKFLLIIILIPLVAPAHPGIGIVKDSKGNIYYTDLKQVWKISKSNREIVVPNVHTHELYMDQSDRLLGEGGYYDGATKKFYHYVWVYKPDGDIDTLVGMREAYVNHDFAFSRDDRGNEYYLKRFLIPHADTSHIYKKSPGAKENVFATGNFRNVNWLYPQKNGSLLYVSGNSIYRVDSLQNIQLIKTGIGNKKPSYKFSENIVIWSVWQDTAQNIFAAVFSDQAVIRIDPNGKMEEVHKSNGNWAPLSGVFDNENRLWVLEGSDKNEVRVILADAPVSALPYTHAKLFSFLFVGCFGLVLFFVYRKFFSK